MSVIVKETYSKEFDRISKRLSNPHRLLNRLSTELRNYIKKGFDTAGRSTGNRWEGHSQVTIDIRKRKGTYNVPQPILIETGQLKRKAVRNKILKSSATGFWLDKDDEKVKGAQIEGVQRRDPGSTTSRTVFRPVYRLENKFADSVVNMSGEFIVSGKVSRFKR